AQSFIVCKEEYAVPLDGSSGRRAKLVSAKRRQGALHEETASIKNVVADELVQAAVKLIGSRARDQADDGARVASVFCAEIVGEHAELAHRFDSQAGAVHASGAVGSIAGECAVNEVKVGVSARAIDRQPRAEAGGGVGASGAVVKYAWRKQRQIGVASAVQ